MTLQVREFATLTLANVESPSVDNVCISKAFFEWLIEIDRPDQPGVKLVRLLSRNTIKLSSYVGYLQAPNGEGIEVLPKTQHVLPDNPYRLRRVLKKMVKASLKIKYKETLEANLLYENQPLHEWIFSEFLQELNSIVQRGLRFDYQTVENETTFVRGQLIMSRQMRQTPDKATHFHVRFAEYTPDRLENRLLKTALNYVLKQTRNNQNWRIANSLSHQLFNIKPISNPLLKIPLWSDGKLLKSYSKVKPWCLLILKQLNPNFQKGKHRGISLLFPMEQLFEQYLSAHISTLLKNDFRLSTQASSCYLTTHIPESSNQMQRLFQLKPDYLVRNNHKSFVLDAKWKLLDTRQNESEENKKYGISQSDLYQLFAYGHKYLNSKGDLMLIYPKHEYFNKPLPVFSFDEQLSLWCVPFDLENDELMDGDWLSKFDCFTGNQRPLLRAKIDNEGGNTWTE